MTEKFFLVKVTIPDGTRFSRELTDNAAAMHLANFGCTMMTFFTDGATAPTVEAKFAQCRLCGGKDRDCNHLFQ